MLQRVTAVSLLAAAAASAAANNEELMNTLGGSRNLGGQENSHGNVMPDVLMPWGFSTWSPDNQADSGGGWYFYDQSTHLAGVRFTHQPSPWIGDYAFFNVMMHVVNPQHDGKTGQYANYDPRASTFAPYLFNATLTPYGTAHGSATIEATATQHGGVMRFSFPAPDSGLFAGSYNATRRVYVSVKTTGGNAVSLSGDGSAGAPLIFTGTSTDGLPDGGKLSFAASLLSASGAPLQPVSTGQGQDGDNLWAWADFDPADNTADVLIFRAAASLISPTQALAAHANEVAGLDFDTVLAANKAAWHDVASKITVTDVGAGRTAGEANDLLTILYSSLYRASKFPRSLWEVDYANGNAPIHWSPYNGKILPGVLSSDVGFWDAFRTTFSLLSLVQPAHLADEMEGFLNTWREAGYVPQWPHPAGGGMAGTMSDVTFSEAVVKLPHCGSARAAAAGYCVNASALYAASRENAFLLRPIDYVLYGYIPFEDGGAMVSDTLLNWHADWAVAQAALQLGFTGDAATLLARAGNFTKLLDPARGFMVPRLKNGSFVADFDEFAWGPGPGYTEAGPWQYRVEVPYAPQALKTALAAIGLDACDVVQQANLIPSTYHAGGYGNVIHEQAEMAANCWGQWELNNQPVWALEHMQVAFDTSVGGKCAQQAQYWLRKSATLFSAGADMFPGDEDNGSMGAWYIFNAIGLYPISPASGKFILGSPLFGSVSIDVGAAQPLVISTVNQGPSNVYVTGATWNGAAVDGVFVAYSDLMQGGTLEFTLAAAPTAAGAAAMPPFA